MTSPEETRQLMQAMTQILTEHNERLRKVNVLLKSVLDLLRYVETVVDPTEGSDRCAVCVGWLDNDPAIIGARIIKDRIVCGECARCLTQPPSI